MGASKELSALTSRHIHRPSFFRLRPVEMEPAIAERSGAGVVPVLDARKPGGILRNPAEAALIGTGNRLGMKRDTQEMT